MVPTQISCAFFPHWGFFWPPSNSICFVSGCSALFAKGLFRLFSFSMFNGMLISNLLSVTSV